jgi:LPXTG-motif cell wall-anchored protein
MDIRKLSWTRGLALFMVLTMVMMYSFTGVVSADANFTLDVVVEKVDPAEGQYTLSGNVVLLKQARAAFIFVLESTNVSKADLIYAVKLKDASLNNNIDYIVVKDIPSSTTVNLGVLVDLPEEDKYKIDVAFDLTAKTFNISPKSVSHMMQFQLEETTPGTIIVNKTFSDDNDAEVTFTLLLNGDDVMSGLTSGQSITFNNLTPGAYTLVESGSPSGYTVSIEGGNVITLAPGGEVTKSVANTLITNETTPGSITVNKTFSDGNESEVTFGLWQDGNEPVVSGQTVNHTITFNNITPGAYTLVESGSPSGYTVSIEGGSVITLAPGGEVTKSVANTLITNDSEDPGTPVIPTTPTRGTPTATIVETAPPLIETPIIDAPVALADILDPNVPQTSDSNNILLLLGLLVASGTGIVALGRRKENAGK